MRKADVRGGVWYYGGTELEHFEDDVRYFETLFRQAHYVFVFSTQ